MTVRILIGDVREKLAELPGESVDCIVTDPPYGETNLGWDRRLSGWLSPLRRVLRPEGSIWCFGTLRFFAESAAAGEFKGWSIAQDVIWEKHNGSSFLNDRFRRVHEQIVQLYPSDRQWAQIYKKPIYTSDATARTVRKKARPPHWHGATGSTVYRSEDGGPRLARSVFYARSEHMRAEHPTQKPIAAILPLIEYSCPPEGTVLDPFAGSGSTGVAAKQLGRAAILIEINPEYAEIARLRIKDDAPLLTEVA